MGVKKQKNNITIFSAFLCLAMLGSASCSNSTNGAVATIKIDGSKTVAPLMAAMTKEFGKSKSGKVDISLDKSSTGKGFEKFCQGELDIANASRPIQEKEIVACKGQGIDFLELPMAYRALTVVVNPGNTWVKSLEVADLRRMWHGPLAISPAGTPAATPPATKDPDQDALPATKLDHWKDVRSSFPDLPLRLFGQVPKSSSYDSFRQALGSRTQFVHRIDYMAGDFDLIGKGVSSDQNALGYVSFDYYTANKNRLKAVPIDSGKGPVEPSTASIQNGTYQPFSSLLFIYVSGKSLNKPQVKEFVDYFVANANLTVIDNKYIPLPTTAYTQISLRARNKKFGSVFDKSGVQDLGINDVIKKF